MVGELTVTTKDDTTVTVATAVLVQPAADVPVTVYDDVVAGVDVAVLTPVTITPADQVYVDAPPAVNVAVPPGQTVGELTVTAGKGFTVIV